MNTLVNMISSSAVEMTSKEIANLLETQHGNVRISIERLAKKEVIQLPPMQLVEDTQSLSPNNKTQVYVFSGEQGKRDSIIVVAQLSPEFTARLVDRWRELEAKSTMLDTTTQLANAVLLAQQVLAERQIRIQHLETKVEEAAPKVQAFDALMNEDGLTSIDLAAKHCGVSPIDFFPWLRAVGILRKDKANWNVPKEEVLKRKYMDVKKSDYDDGMRVYKNSTSYFTNEGLVYIRGIIDKFKVRNPSEFARTFKNRD